MLSPATLLALTVGYLGALIAIARVGDRWPPARALSRRPLVAALALGVYATSWSYFGSVGFAAREGWRYLAIYVGVTASCALIPVMWAPLHRLVRERQLGSLADLLAFRYQRPAVGAAVTGFLLAGSLPYQALQLRALVASVDHLGGAGAPIDVAWLISGGLVVVGVVTGARHPSLRDRHDGLVLAVAFESVVKLVALIAITLWALVSVFGGPAGLDRWLTAHPEQLAAMARPARDGDWLTLLALSAGAAFLLPRQWHLAFTESAGEGGLRATGWVLPAYLVVLTLAVPPILWAGRALGLGGDADFYVLGLARASGSPLLAAVVFVGALAAATAMIVVTTVALAAMAQNHLGRPATAWAMRGDPYRRLRWLRRGLVAVIILAGHAVYLGLRDRAELADLGLVSFVAVAQLVPGVVGVLWWPRASGAGALAGLAIGAAAWAALLLAPLFGADVGVLAALGVDGDPWPATAALTLGPNLLAFVIGSMVWPPRPAEVDAAATCARRPGVAAAAAVTAGSPDELAARLAAVLGVGTAGREVDRALADLGLGRDERRPGELRALRDRVEHNLSGLLGPLPARAAVDDALPLDPDHALVLAQLRFVAEHRAAAEAPARELDLARRYLRRVLDDLPIGVATLAPGGEVILWNPAMTTITGVAASGATGLPTAALPPPWGEVLAGFAVGAEPRAEVTLPGVRPRTIALGRTELGPGALVGAGAGGVILLVEDLSDERALAAQVAHQERLASIGRLAAGVAHEVGNPLTGVKLTVANLRRELADPDVRARLDLVLAAGDRIDRIVRALVGYAHAGDAARGPRGPVELAPLVADAITLTRLTRAGKALALAAAVPAGLRVIGDRPQLEQVVVNLLANASDASAPGGAVEVHARADGDRVVLEVIDRGAGMAPEVVARAVEPFFTTKPPGEGTGLGLALVYSIVVDHGGTLALDSAPGVGTTARVTLPAP